MRSNAPLLSQEINDIILCAYEKYVKLLGFDDQQGNTTYSGIYDIIETDLQNITSTYLLAISDDESDLNNINYKISLIRSR